MPAAMPTYELPRCLVFDGADVGLLAGEAGSGAGVGVECLAEECSGVVRHDVES